MRIFFSASAANAATVGLFSILRAKKQEEKSKKISAACRRGDLAGSNAPEYPIVAGMSKLGYGARTAAGLVARTAGDCGDGCVGRCGHLPGARLRRLCRLVSRRPDIAALRSAAAALFGRTLGSGSHAGGLGGAACLVRVGPAGGLWNGAAGGIRDGSGRHPAVSGRTGRLASQSILSGYEGLAHYLAHQYNVRRIMAATRPHPCRSAST